MRKKIVFVNVINILLVAGVLIVFTSCVQNCKILLGESTNAEVIAAMTLEEKTELLVGDDPGFPRGYPSGFGGSDTLYDKQPPVVGTTKKIVPGAAGTTCAIPRLGIPSIVLADGPAGVRIDPYRDDTSKTYFATAFPIESLLACSWDTSLVKKVGVCVGKEALEYGVDVMLSPALNIHRNPLGGRNFEYYSEDPVVSGEMAAAMVNGVQSQGVGTSVKHFVANNNETNRMSINAIVNEKTLHEIYLKGFEIAVKKSNPWTVMSAYNKINGTYCSENSVLLDSILRKDWGFDGFVMTDWFAGRDRIQQVVVGNDLQMPGSKHIAEQIALAVKNGDLDEKIVDRNVDRILNIIKKSPRFNGYKNSDNPNLKEHAKVSQQAAEDGMVLLKNSKQTLPIDKNIKKIAAFGNATYQTIAVGTGSGNVNCAYTKSIYEGLTSNGYILSDDIKQKTLTFIEEDKQRKGQKSSYFDPDIMLDEKDWGTSELASLAKSNDIALFTISRTSGEFADRKIKNDFELTSAEKNMLRKLNKAFHAENKKVIVLLNIGGVIETQSWKNLADAILLIWQPGQEAGYAIADILMGKSTPSGKLSMSFPIQYADVPSANCFPDAANNPKEVKYAENGMVGYRYYLSQNIETSYEFGYGLSYTSFEYSNYSVSNLNNNQCTVSFTVKNTGKYNGKEIAQLYVKSGNGVTQLKHFAKTKNLKPGESENITIEVTPNDFMSYNVDNKSWEIQKGTYQLIIGASCLDTKFQKGINK